MTSSDQNVWTRANRSVTEFPSLRLYAVDDPIKGFDVDPAQKDLMLGKGLVEVLAKPLLLLRSQRGSGKLRVDRFDLGDGLSCRQTDVACGLLLDVAMEGVQVIDAFEPGLPGNAGLASVRQPPSHNNGSDGEGNEQGPGEQRG